MELSFRQPCLPLPVDDLRSSAEGTYVWRLTLRLGLSLPSPDASSPVYWSSYRSFKPTFRESLLACHKSKTTPSK